MGQPPVQSSPHIDAGTATKLVAAGVTTQPVDTVIAVLAAHRDGASINAAAKTCGVNFRTAQRIVLAAADYSEEHLSAAG
jgi:molybdenum-dependent DNA-binding transcriptional regulator ModE